MNNGFIKVAAASPIIKTGQIKENVLEIKKCIDLAVRSNAKILVFPELCITGACGGDIYYDEDILDASNEAIRSIKEYAADKDMLIAIGSIDIIKEKIVSTVFVIKDGIVLGTIHKRLGDKSLNGLASDNIIICDENIGLKIGVEVGEDWKNPFSSGANLIANGVQIILNPTIIYCQDNATEINVDYVAYSRRLRVGIVAASLNEISSTIIPKGVGLIIENGEFLENSSCSNEMITISEIDFKAINAIRRKDDFIPNNEFGNIKNISIFFDRAITELTRKYNKNPYSPADGNWNKRSEEILVLQAKGLLNRMITSRANKLVLGISGGLDSTLALLVCVRALKFQALPMTNLIAITMPCFGTSNRTKSNAEKLCEALGVTFKTIDIKESVLLHLNSLGHSGNADVTFENAQARERTQILFDYANMCGGLVVGTGDMSELALGWCTFNGDHMSSYGVNATLTKTTIREVVRYEAERLNSIKEYLLDVLDTPVSPELLPLENGIVTQSTEEILGPYILHDFFIYHYSKYGMGKEKIFRIASATFKEYSKEVICKALEVFFKRYNNSAFKRNCSPDCVIIEKNNILNRTKYMPSDAKIM